jgi:hypothetical protein
MAKRMAKAKAAAEAFEDWGPVTFDGSVDKCVICYDACMLGRECYFFSCTPTTSGKQSRPCCFIT